MAVKNRDAVSAARRVPLADARRALHALKQREGGVIRGRQLFPLVRPPEAEPAAPTLDLGTGWFAVHTNPLAEFEVENDLREAGFSTFLPKYTKTVKHARRVRERKLPLFPRYLFVAFNPSHGKWGAISHIDGVVRLLVSAGDNPIRAPDRLISALMVDDLLKTHDVTEVAGQEPPPPRKTVSKKEKSWKGRKERARERERRKKAKAMGEWLAEASCQIVSDVK